MRKIVSCSTGSPASTSRVPVARHVHDLAVPGDGEQPPRQPPVVDVAPEVPVEPRQPLGVDPDLSRIHLDLQLPHAPDGTRRLGQATSAWRARAVGDGGTSSSCGLVRSTTWSPRVTVTPNQSSSLRKWWSRWARQIIR